MKVFESGCIASSDWYFILKKNDNEYKFLSKHIIYSSENNPIGIFSKENILSWQEKYNVFICNNLDKLECILKIHDYVAININKFLNYVFKKEDDKNGKKR